MADDDITDSEGINQITLCMHADGTKWVGRAVLENRVGIKPTLINGKNRSE